MPYKIKKSGNGYKVHSPSGPKSKKPLSKQKALAQQRAIYANTKGESYQRRLHDVLCRPIAQLVENVWNGDQVPLGVLLDQLDDQYGWKHETIGEWLPQVLLRLQKEVTNDREDYLEYARELGSEERILVDYYTFRLSAAGINNVYMNLCNDFNDGVFDVSNGVSWETLHGMMSNIITSMDIIVDGVAHPEHQWTQQANRLKHNNYQYDPYFNEIDHFLSNLANRAWQMREFIADVVRRSAEENNLEYDDEVF